MKRRSPIHHKVRSHKRQGKRVISYERGKGQKSQKSRKRKIVENTVLPTKVEKGYYDVASDFYSYYTLDVPHFRIKFYPSRKELVDFVSRKEGIYNPYISGYADVETNTVHVLEGVLNGDKTIDSEEEYRALTKFVHELGHLSNPIHPHYRTHGIGLDEGCDEILAQRYVLNNFEINPEIEWRLRTSPKGYFFDQRIAAKIALLASSGDKKKSIKWIRDVGYGSDRENKRALSSLKQKSDKHGLDYNALIRFGKWGGSEHRDIEDLERKINKALLEEGLSHEDFGVDTTDIYKQTWWLVV